MACRSPRAASLAELDGEPFVEEYPTRGVLLRPQRGDLRDLGLPRRRPRARRRRGDEDASSERRRRAGGEHPPLRHRLLVPLRPLPAPSRTSPAPPTTCSTSGSCAVLNRLTPRPQFAAAAIDRFEAYRALARVPGPRRIAEKVAFRLSSPATSCSPTACRGTAKEQRPDVTASAAAPTFWSSATTRSARPGRPHSRSPRSCSSEQLALPGRQGLPGRHLQRGGRRRGDGKGSRSPSTTATARCWSWPCRSSTSSACRRRVFVPTDYIGSERPMSWPGIERGSAASTRGADPDVLGRGRAAARRRLGDRLAHPLASETDPDLAGPARPSSSPSPGGAAWRCSACAPRSPTPTATTTTRSSSPPARPATRRRPRCPTGRRRRRRWPGHGSASTTMTTCAASASRSRRWCGGPRGSSAWPLVADRLRALKKRLAG